MANRTDSLFNHLAENLAKRLGYDADGGGGGGIPGVEVDPVAVPLVQELEVRVKVLEEGGIKTEETDPIAMPAIELLSATMTDISDKVHALEAGGVWRGTFSTYADLIQEYPNLDVTNTGWNHNDFVEIRADESDTIAAHTVGAPSSYIVVAKTDNNGNEIQVLTYRRDDPTTVQIATNNSLGVIKGTTNSGGVSITSTGEGRVNGFLSQVEIQEIIDNTPDKTNNLNYESLTANSSTGIASFSIGFVGNTTGFEYTFTAGMGLGTITGVYTDRTNTTLYSSEFDINKFETMRQYVTLQKEVDGHQQIIWNKDYSYLDYGRFTEEDPVALAALSTHSVDNMRHVSTSEKTLIAEVPQLEVGINSVHNSVTDLSTQLLVHASDSATHVTATEQATWTSTSNSFNTHSTDNVIHISSAEHTALTELIEGGGGGEDRNIDWVLWESGDWDMSSTYVDFPSYLPSNVADVLIRFTFAIPYSDPEYSYHTSAEWVMRADAYRRGAFGLSAVVRKFTGSGYSAYTAGFSIDVSGYRFIVNQVLPSDCVLEKYAIYTRDPIIIPGGSASGVAADLQVHKDSDVDRWKEFYAFKKEMLDFKAGVQNKVLDIPGTEDIESAAQGSGFFVGSALGGRITFTDVIVLLDLIPGSVSVNGQVVWSGQALGIGEIEDYVDVNYEDIVTCSGITSITFTPYVPA